MCRELLFLGFIFLAHAQKLEEGSRCTDSGGVEGICRKARVCPSVALNPQNEVEVICSHDGAEPVVCCTDCYINDVSNAVVTAGGIVWKTAGKRRAYDKCAEYASTLPYACNMGLLRVAVNQEFDPKQRCHLLKVSVRKQPPTKPPPPPTVKFPYLALLGFPSKSTNEWKCQGAIISERFVLTTAHCQDDQLGATVDRVAVEIDKRRDFEPLNFHNWKIYKVKWFHAHPEYKRSVKLNDIGLVETETPIQFNVNVLPICLAEQFSELDTIKTDVLAIKEIKGMTFYVHRKSREECAEKIPLSQILPKGINYTTQDCYPNIPEAEESCFGSSGRPIYTTGDIMCMKYAVGIPTFGSVCQDNNESGFTVYVRIPAYLSWIEDTVWPSSQ